MTCIGGLYVVRRATINIDVVLRNDGNLTQDGDIDIAGIDSEELHCTECGPLGVDEFEAHGVSEEWEWT